MRFDRSALLAILTLGLGLPGCSGDDDDLGEGEGEGEGGEGEGGEGEGGEGEGEGGEGEGEGCATADTECPEEQPIPSGPCEGELQCEYTAGAGTWQYECIEGRWDADVDCQLDGGGCTPPLWEICLDPFQGEQAAEVRIGPSDVLEPFRPFEESEQIPLVIGPQGGAMLAFRVQVVDGAAPECVGATFRTVFRDEPLEVAQRVTLHCGVSLPVFVIFPGDFCESATYPVDVEVEVAGIGTTTVGIELVAEGECAG